MADNPTPSDLLDAIDNYYGNADIHGGDVLDEVRNVVGRDNFDNYWALSPEELTKAIAHFNRRF